MKHPARTKRKDCDAAKEGKGGRNGREKAVKVVGPGSKKVGEDEDGRTGCPQRKPKPLPTL